MIEIGAHQDLLNVNGEKTAAFTIPSFGVTFGANEPGLHFRAKGNTSYRNFHLSPHQDSSSTLKIILGAEYIFNPISSIYPYFYSGFQYRYSEEKYDTEQLSSYTEYHYIKMRTLSIPVLFGFFYPLSKYFLISLEAEVDAIPFYCSFSGQLKEQANSYREYNFAVYLGIGISY